MPEDVQRLRVNADISGNAQVPMLQLIWYTSGTLKICPNLLLTTLTWILENLVSTSNHVPRMFYYKVMSSLIVNVSQLSNAELPISIYCDEMLSIWHWHSSCQTSHLR